MVNVFLNRNISEKPPLGFYIVAEKGFVFGVGSGMNGIKKSVSRALEDAASNARGLGANCVIGVK